MDQLRQRKTVRIIDSSHFFMESWRPLLQHLFKRIGHAQLPVDNDLMAVPNSQALWVYDLLMSSAATVQR